MDHSPQSPGNLIDTGIGVRRINSLRDLTDRTAGAKTVDDVCRAAMEALSQNKHDIPFAALYLLDPDGMRARLAGNNGQSSGEQVGPKVVVLDGVSNGAESQPFSTVIRTQRSELINCISGFWNPNGNCMSTPPQSALVLPLCQPDRKRLAGFLITGINPSLSLDDHYRGFLEVVADKIASAITIARATEDGSFQLKDGFLSIVAHELKTPLTSLRGFAQLLFRQLERGDSCDPDLLHQAVTVIYNQSVKLSRLVEQLLDISLSQEGYLAIHPEPTDLVPLVKGVVKMAQMGTNQHKIVVRVPDRAIARIDPLRIEQVLVNIVDNAIKFSPDGGTVEADLVEEHDTVQISVRDHGVGIPEEHRKHIFDRYYQAHADHNLGGIGIGLYISKLIVALHSGRIYAQFPPDGGTRFVVSLPKVIES